MENPGQNKNEIIEIKKHSMRKKMTLMGSLIVGIVEERTSELEHIYQ